MIRKTGQAFLALASLLLPSVTGRAVDALAERDLTTSMEIVSGATWTDTNTGNHIQAHGAGYILVNGVYYMIGEDKTNGSAFQNINCYSSTDLVTWTFVNHVLTQQSSGDLGPNRVVERPKVIYHSGNKQYVMWMHIDSSDYSEAKVGVATSNTVCGNYAYRGSFNPLGNQSRDMGLFQDTDGTAYLMTEDRPNGIHIEQLSADYLSVSKMVQTFGTNLEAPAMIKQNGVYYMFGSYLTGWNFNDNVYLTATSLSGPWSNYQNFAPSGSHTYDSQVTFVLQTPKGVVYFGDRWHSENFIKCTYVTLPLAISGTTVTMNNNYQHWLPATFKSGPSLTTTAWTSGSLSNGAKSVSCSQCNGGNAAGYIGGPSNGAITFSGLYSSSAVKKTVQFTYENGDGAQRFAKVTVNGGTAQRIAFVPTGGGDYSQVSTFNVALAQGSSNTIKIEGLGDGSYGPDISQISIPQF